MHYYVYLWSGSGPCNAWALLWADTRPSAHTHTGWPLQMKHKRVYCGVLCPALINSLQIALCWCMRACVYRNSPIACGYHSSLPAAAAAAHSRGHILAGSGTCCRRRHEMRPCPCAQTAKHNNYQWDASPTGLQGGGGSQWSEGKRWRLHGVIMQNEGGNLCCGSFITNSPPPLVLCWLKMWFFFFLSWSEHRSTISQIKADIICKIFICFLWQRTSQGVISCTSCSIHKKKMLLSNSSLDCDEYVLCTLCTIIQPSDHKCLNPFLDTTYLVSRCWKYSTRNAQVNPFWVIPVKEMKRTQWPAVCGELNGA